MAYYGYSDTDKSVIETDITNENIIKTIDDVVSGKDVDVIIGGPPCQAYSTAGRVRNGEGMSKDPRNFLFESYVHILNHFLPNIIAKTKCAKIENETSKTYLFFASQFSATLSNV